MPGEEFGPSPEEIDQPQELTSPEADFPKSWGELRETVKSTPYSERFSDFMGKSRGWLSTPRTGVSPEEWDSQIGNQLTKAKDLVGEDILTRIYIGVDPRHAADAFRALLDELGKQDVLKDIDVALHLGVLEEGKLAGNQIIIYDPRSRPEVLGSILEGYNQAKISNPDLFRLSDRQKEWVMREHLIQFKAVIDENASFVEMAPEDGRRSWDIDIVNQIREEFGLGRISKSDQEWLETVRKKEGRFVWTNADRDRLDKGLVRPGVVFHYKRRLAAPALVQTGTVTAK